MLLFTSLPAAAQYNASLQGTIQDPSGGLIPNAGVKLENNGTHSTQKATSNNQGFYRFEHLPAGTYTLTVTAKGFQSTSLTDLSVAADLPQSRQVTMQPGNVQTSITVTAASTPVLQTADASVSATITSRSVEDLPTFGRDPYELIRTAPGTDSTGGRSGNGNTVFLGNSTGPGQSNIGIFQTENQVQVSSAGQRVEQNVYYIDGVNVNSLGWGGAAVVTPNTESVQDITVITADYDAADGRGSGAHIKTTTKSGTDQFHGSAVFLYQDPNFNAYNKWGGPSGGRPTRVQNNYRQYAASLGGPIVKDKFFFFLSYEGLHNKSVTYGDSWVTTPQYRQLVTADRPNSTIAHILNSVNANPRINAILGGPSASCSVFGAHAATLCRQVPGGLDVGSPGPGVGGTPYYPNPNAGSQYLPGAIGGGFDGSPDLEYVQYYLPTEQIGNQFNGRFDLNLTSKDLIFVSAYVTHLNQVGASASSAGAPDTDLPFKPLSTAITAAYTSNWSPTTINELRANFTRFADNQLNDSGGANWGIPYVQLEGYPFGSIGVAGLPWGTDTPAILAQNTYEVRDVLNKVWGNHTVRFGGEFRWEQDNDNLLGSERPLYSFSGLWNLANDAPIFEDIYANANTGGPANAARYFRDHIAGLFAQDDWHVTPSLTLTLGLRWEYFSPLTESQGVLDNIFLGANGPFPLVDAQVRHVNRLWNSNWKDFEPRIGFAYAPIAAHERFVVRGGFGILYN
ncbi:MAG: TonB-dependent receptor domain-containing protein, partial [Bryobacteraceae bacterium]